MTESILVLQCVCECVHGEGGREGGREGGGGDVRCHDNTMSKFNER